MMQFFSNLKPAEKIVLAAIALNHFSFWPSIVIDRSKSSGLEMAMLSGVLIVVYSLYIHRDKILKDVFTINPWWWLFAWGAYGITLSLLMTNNLTINILRAGYLTSMILASYCVYWLITQKYIRVAIIMQGWLYLAVIFSVIAILQFIIGAFIVDAFLRDRYTVGTFAFPRVHGFAFEPLFFANWLLPPLLYGFYTFSRQSKFYLFLILLAFLLTLSRGAFIALAVGMIILVFFSSSRKLFIMRSAKILAAALLVCLSLVGFSATANQSTFSNGVGRYLDHATLGIFNQEGATNVAPTNVELPDGTVVESFIPANERDDAGVVEASAKSRVEVSSAAVETYGESITNTIFGIGMFRTGEELLEKQPELYNSEDLLSNNQVLDVVVETGVIGITLLIGFGIATWKYVRDSDIWMFAVLAALLVQFLTFSGYFLIPFWMMLAILIGSPRSKKKGLHA